MNLYNKYMVQLLRVTQEAAVACYPWIGLGKEKDADRAAVESMRGNLNKINFNARIVIGEGERDKAPMLFIGEGLGSGTEEIDIAVDPLEGTTICASNAPNSIVVLAAAKRGDFLHAPDVYMDKIAAPALVPVNAIDLDNTPTQNVNNICDALGCAINDIAVTVLKRDRHVDLINELRLCGVRVNLITDGDVMAVISTALGDSDYINIYMGSGGAPEGVLAAAALKTLGGSMQGRLLYKDEAQRQRAKEMGVAKLDYQYTIDDMVKGDALFIATGVTSGALLDGVSIADNRVHTHSLVLYSCENQMDFISCDRKIY